MKENTYLKRMTLVRSIVSFLTVVLAILLFCCHGKFIYAAIMVMEEIPYMHRTYAAHVHNTPEYQIFIFPPLFQDPKEMGLP